MSIIQTSAVYKSLKAILENIITDPVESGTRDLIYPKYLDVKSMSDNYEIDQEVAGTLLLQEKAEGAAAAVGSLQEGYETRYIARTWALHMHVAEEAIEDTKYDKYINAAKRLTRSAAKTQDYDAANLIIRSTNTSYLGGDGLCLGNSAHTLPYGGTWSNIADVYQTPSRAALISAITKTGKFPSPNGLTEGYSIKKIVCPLAQWATWEGITKSAQAPESNNNEINVVGPKGSMGGIEIVAVKYLDASSTTLWGAITEADNGLQWRNRRKPKSRTWVDNDAEVMKYGVSYRASRGWSDPRGWYQGNT
jgi:hypothetical protein